MQRREFFAVAGAVAAYSVRSAEFGVRSRRSSVELRTPHSAFRTGMAQEPSLSPEVFARRLDRARAELKARGLRCLIATPGTNYEYLTGYNPGRSERLIALILPVDGVPAVVCPSFEVERIKRHSVIADAPGWEEQDDPYGLVRDTVRRLAPRAGTIALESSTGYQSALRLAAALSGWKFVDAAPVTERLRIVKAPEEVALIRRAIEITQGAMAATFGQLAVGMTERDVARLLSREKIGRASCRERVDTSVTGVQTCALPISLRLAAALSGWKFVDAAPVTERLRIVKAPEEVALIRRAIEITQGAMAATFGQLAVGMTERDVARLLSRE